MNTAVDEGEMDVSRRHCVELSQQVYNFHQQNEQLMQDLQEVNNLKLQIQMENNRLHEDNLNLQKKLQAFLGDKTKYSIGALRDPTSGADMGDKESESSTSVTAKTDIELLERQISQGELLRSGEVTSVMEEELKSKLQVEKERGLKQAVRLNSQEAQVRLLVQSNLC